MKIKRILSFDFVATLLLSIRVLVIDLLLLIFLIVRLISVFQSTLDCRGCWI